MQSWHKPQYDAGENMGWGRYQKESIKYSGHLATDQVEIDDEDDVIENIYGNMSLRDHQRKADNHKEIKKYLGEDSNLGGPARGTGAYYRSG